MATPNTSFHDPGPRNVFIPAATSQLQVEFSRNPTSFKINRYVQIVPERAINGYFPELSSTDPVTLVTEEDDMWPDGQERPWGKKRPLRWKAWAMERRANSYPLGQLTVEQAPWDIVAAHGRGEAARSMTSRTLEAKTVFETSGNWPAANTSATVDALLSTSGATWVGSGATTTARYILRSFNKIKQVIQQQTGGVVSSGMLQCVINPVTADAMARTPEVREYMVNHAQALAVLAGEDRRIVDDWGLPPTLYGVVMTVEDAVRQTTRRVLAGTGTLGYLMSDNVALFTSRVGGLVAQGMSDDTQAAPSFTTLTGFFNEEMTVETESDGWNRLVKGSVVENRDIVLTAPNSGYLMQDVST